MLEGDNVLKIFLLNLLLANGYHAIADVDSNDLLGLDTFSTQDSKITCSCGDIQNALRLVFA